MLRNSKKRHTIIGQRRPDDPRIYHKTNNMTNNKAFYEPLTIEAVKVGAEKGFCASYDDDQSRVMVSEWKLGEFEGQ